MIPFEGPSTIGSADVGMSSGDGLGEGGFAEVESIDVEGLSVRGALGAATGSESWEKSSQTFGHGSVRAEDDATGLPVSGEDIADVAGDVRILDARARGGEVRRRRADVRAAVDIAAVGPSAEYRRRRIRSRERKKARCGSSGGGGA
jgi:hypothetical protein